MSDKNFTLTTSLKIYLLVLIKDALDSFNDFGILFECMLVFRMRMLMAKSSTASWVQSAWFYKSYGSF